MNSSHCPQCNCSTKVVKIGLTSAKRQRYRCNNCHKTWTNKARPKRLAERIWHDFVWDNLPARALAKRYQKHPNTIRKILHHYTLPPIDLNAFSKTKKEATSVIVMDTTYFSRKHGVVVILNAHTGELLYFKEIFRTETIGDYLEGVNTLFAAGIHPKACIVDGRRGLIDLMESKGLHVQMCQYHMWQIVRRYLTLSPVLEPNIELKTIIDGFISKHTYTDERLFATQIRGWRNRNLHWLNEKHRNEYGKYEWNHEETRRAYNAIIHHGRWLFTYEKYPELDIPRTSNVIEGKFGNAKDKLRLHHGYTDMLKIKIFFSLLSGL